MCGGGGGNFFEKAHGSAESILLLCNIFEFIFELEWGFIKQSRIAHPPPVRFGNMRAFSLQNMWRKTPYSYVWER